MEDNTHNAFAHTRSARIFISYKRNVTPDEQIALTITEALAGRHDVFIDQNMPVGTPWAERIEAKISESDFLIVFLSAHSVNSEMVKAEVATAHRLARERSGKPIILPVRLAYRDPFQYPLSAYLDPLQWAIWKDQDDTKLLIAELTQAIGGGELSITTDLSKITLLKERQLKKDALSEPLPDAQPARRKLQPPEELEDPEQRVDKFYVERVTDALALNAATFPKKTLTIKGPEQMGKSALLFRALKAAAEKGKRVAFLDFQLIGESALKDRNVFYREFCAMISDELELADETERFWSGHRENIKRCTHYMRDYILPGKNLPGEKKPLVLAMDEAEALFGADYRLEFFGMIRGWHEKRGSINFPIWDQLNIILVTSTEPRWFIDNPRQSPFNVGQVIELEDFTSAQVDDLNTLHRDCLPPGGRDALMAQIGGHPYLVRRALYLVASQIYTLTGLLAVAADDYGPFGDHLRTRLYSLLGKENLLQGLQQIIKNRVCQDERVFSSLRGAGLVRGECRDASLRCPLYETFFRRHLNV